MKKIFQAIALLLSVGLMGYSASLRAEDIDIYVDTANTSGIPNVLFVIDTGANFESSAAVPCTAYASGGAPSLGTSVGAVEQCALVNAIQGLANGVVNIGIMVNNNNNFANDVRSTSDVAYHELCGGTGFGGCVARKLTFMDAAGKAGMVNFIKSWKTTGQNSATEFNVKSGGDRTANMMQEAWAYYHGKVGMSGTNYGTSILASGCQKNFVVFIGNSFSNSGGPADTGNQSPYDGTNALTSSQVNATADQKLKISETVKFASSTCGVTSIAASTSASNWSENWADEWARLMYKQDGGTSSQENAQNITTYTIGLVNDGPNTCKADYPALLSTMAKYGGGKYFKTSNAVDLKIAVEAILNEVQAVNSVFSSASLPVSVNAEGSYLNQIYLGMFRPDSTAAPRWMGNLKQYQLIKNASDVTVMGDSAGQPAISSSGTGFISPNAISFWTYKNTATAPDDAATGGFWVNDKRGVPESGFDSPDGEVVEKGGAGQQIRKQNLTATFTGASGASGNPRRIYTYCPTGSSCVASLTDASNDFSTANTGIPNSAFGSSTTIRVNSIVRTGSEAVVTTNGNHGFIDGTVVSISNAGQPEYNVTQGVTVLDATRFKITGLPDYPTTPSLGAYTISRSSVGASILTLSRSSSAAGNSNSEVVTVTTSSSTGLAAGGTLKIAGTSENLYNGNWNLLTSTGTSMTFSTPIYPVTPAVNSYKVVHQSYTRSITLIKTTGSGAGKIATVTTSTPHGFHVGQQVTLSSTGEGAYNGTQTITQVPTSTQFVFSVSGNPAQVNTGSVSPSTTAQNITSLTRTGTGSAATATATVSTANLFANGDAVRITTTGTSPNETQYAIDTTISCSGTCTTFTYPIATAPSLTSTGGTASSLPANVTVAAGSLTRNGTVTTVINIPAGTFANGDTVDVAASGTALSSESGYVGTWQITCSGTCTSFTYGPVPLTPTTPATGSNILAYSASTPPDRDTVIKWVRGADNYGDEKGPGGSISVRPSVHGDVLHSRPLVVNYGDSRGIVVFYGSNDGLFRAVNGNQTADIGSVPAGGELWGMLLPEHFSLVNRLRLNSPELKFPSTTLTTAEPKNYFVDGPTGSYQKYNANGTINTSYIFLTMRRGGRYMYGMNVSTPTSPSVMWKITNETAGFEELGQTWSRPRATVVQGGGLGTNPVIVFGAGYDPASQDLEPPGTDTMGRGIYVVNAATGALIWSANSTCTTSATCRNVPGMTYAIPSDITTVDRDNNGFTDKLYFGDLGGNVWRADISDASTANWTVTKIAALGCNTGTCSAGTTPRKFFFPPEVLTIKGSGAVGSYEAISIVSGDREHPLKSDAAGSSYAVNDRFFMIKDTGTALGTPITSNVTPQTLFNSTSTDYNNSGDGFYINFATGEKGVNAPLAVSGKIFFATNRPVDRSLACAANLGEAKAYAVSPFTGDFDTKVLAGGGLPPSPVSGLVTLRKTADDGTEYSENEKFCIGCSVGCEGSTCDVALENTPPPIVIPKNLRRTYWYRK